MKQDGIEASTDLSTVGERVVIYKPQKAVKQKRTAFNKFGPST